MNNSPFDNVVDRSESSSIKWQKFGDGVIPAWVADMEFATSPAITDALSKRIEHPIFGYTSAPESLVKSVSDYCSNRHSLSIDPDCLHWVPGVLPAMTAACQIAGEKGDEIIVFPPVYYPLLEIPEKIGKTRIDVPFNYTPGDNDTDGQWSIDLDQVEAAFSDKTAAVLISSPHNPMGVMFSEQELYRLACMCAARNVLLISDEIHCDLILNPDKQHIPTARAAAEHHPSVITIMSPSKTFNVAGANCSFAYITDPECLEKFQKECHFTVPFVPTLSYTVAEAAYSNGWQWHSELIEYLRANHDYLYQVINETDGLSMDRLDATYLAWIDTRNLATDNANDLFTSAGVGLSPGSQFGDDNYQRLNFACSRTQLEEIVRRMRKAISNT